MEASVGITDIRGMQYKKVQQAITILLLSIAIIVILPVLSKSFQMGHNHIITIYLTDFVREDIGDL